MNQFFRYYGAKYRMAKYFDRPRRDLVIEPFAGSAGYSTWWAPPRVRLYDLNEEIVRLWDWLINCSTDDIRALPDTVEHSSELYELGYAEGRFIYKWLVINSYKDGGMPRNSNLALHKRQLALGETGKWWNPRIKNQIIAQKPLIAEWTIEQMSYERIPNVEAHWHIDPPYNSKAGSRYHHGSDDIDFDHLADWCRTREGDVDVCEMEGADWLPFEPLVTHPGNGGYSSYTEMIWRNRPPRQGILL